MMPDNGDDRTHEEFVAGLEQKLISGVEAAKRAISELPPAEQARAAAEIAAALLDGLDRLRETIDVANEKALDS